MNTKQTVKLIIVLAFGLLLVSCSLPSAAGTGNTVAEPAEDQASGPSKVEDSVEEPSGPSAALTELEGDVQTRRTDKESFHAARVGDQVYLSGQVQTGQDGRAKLAFSDGSIVRVASSSLFTMQTLEEEDGGWLKRLTLEFGQLWIVLNGGRLEVDTSSGVASVTGSYMSVWQDPDTGELYITCLEGTCTLESGGDSVTLSAGQTAQVLGAGGTPVTGTMSLEEIQAWLDAQVGAELVASEVPGSVGDLVWLDANANGLQDSGESGQAGITVSLLSAEGDVLQTTTTDENGAYTFTPLFEGSYQLSFEKPVQLVFTAQDQGSDDTLDSDVDPDGLTAIFNLLPGEHRTSLDAGLVQPAAGSVCPLTGLPIGDPALLDLRPIFISISHFPAGATRPPTGLNSAPVVFETLIDEGMTRLQALFYCGYPETLPENDGGSTGGSGDSGSDSGATGSGFDISGVRSGRVFYAELSQLFGAGLIFAGADPSVYQTIAPYTCAFADSSNPGDIGAAGLDVNQLQNIAGSCQSRLGNTDLDVWQFGPPPAGGMAADKFLMYYNYMNRTRWVYDASAGGYVRYQNDPANPEEFTLSTDRLTGEAIVRQNVIILETPHQVMNSSGTIIEFDLTDERGYAYLLRDGSAYKVCWSAMFDDYATPSNRYRPFLLQDCTTKEPINFAYGSTWINVVDSSVGYEWVGDYWRAYQPFLGYGD